VSRLKECRGLAPSTVLFSCLLLVVSLTSQQAYTQDVQNAESPAPVITSDRHIGLPAQPRSTVFTFINETGWEDEGPVHFLYAWNQLPSCGFTWTESTWDSGALELIGMYGGAWYLHLLPFNANNVYGAVTTLGPFEIQEDVSSTKNSVAAVATKQSIGLLPDFERTAVVTGLTQPVSMMFLPDGRL